VENVGVAQRKDSLGNLIKLLAVSAGHFINDFYMNLIPPILFLFTNAMSLSLTQQALIASVITSSGSFAQPVIGHFVDKHGKPWFLILSVLWIGFWMSMAGVINNYYLLLLITGLGALASALYHPMGSAAAIKLGRRTRGTSLSIFMTVGGFATAIPPLIALPIVRDHGLSTLPYFMIPGFLIAASMYFAKVQHIEVTCQSLNTKDEKKKLDFYTYKWVSALVIIATYRTLLTRILMTFGIQLLLLKEVDLYIAALILSSYLFLNAAGTITGGILNDVIGSKKVIIITNAIAILCLVGIFLTSGLPLILSFIFIGFILTGGNTSNIVMTHDLLPNNINMGTGLIMGIGGGLAGIGILVYGKLADTFGLLNATGLFIIPLIILNILSLFLPNKRSNDYVSIAETTENK